MKNIIFVFRSTALFSYSSSIINEITKNGNKVTLVFIRENSNDSTVYSIKINEETGLKELVSEKLILNSSEVLISESEKISIIKGKERSDRWTYILRVIRETLSFISYIKRGDNSNFFYNQKRYVPKIIGSWISFKIVGKYLFPISIIYKVLEFINEIIPASKEIKTLIDSLKANCVVVVGANWPTNPTHFSSGIDYIKACSVLKIPSVIQIVSWDNLTSRGIYHYKPTLMLAWNRIHKEEAINIHNIPKQRIEITGSPFMDKWFNHKFTIRTKQEFFSALNMNPNVPLVTYLGSSKNVVGDFPKYERESGEKESVIAERLFQNLRQKGVQLIIRPHGSNSSQFRKLASKIPVIPLQGDLPDTDETKKLMIETLTYSSATIGINTTGMVDSVVLGTPCVALIKEEFDLGQSLTSHFQNIRRSKIFPEANSESDATDVLTEIIFGEENFKEKEDYSKFITNFCRPQGIGISAGKLSSELIISLANSDKN